MSSRCKHCWTPRLSNSEINPCKYCIHQPGFSDMYLSHPVTCKFGYTNCVNDPGYIYAHHPEWYKELYGNMDFRKAARDPESGCNDCTKEHCQYDDEDK